jgi:hypothetical protein
MPFARQVSIGRVALVNFPEAEAGKLVVISDVVSANAVSVRRRRQQCHGWQSPSCWAPWQLQRAEEQLETEQRRLAAAWRAAAAPGVLQAPGSSGGEATAGGAAPLQEGQGQ